MRFFRLQAISLSAALAVALALGFLITTQPTVSYSQETTGGLQGTVKDPSGAVVPKAKVFLTGTSMIGNKELVTDNGGYYHFANLPPGTYSISITAPGFTALKRNGLMIEAGRLPTVDITLQIGAAATTVEVTESGPVIDTTTTQNITNVNSRALKNLPTGTTFQSVIQFAPMARQEPLAGESLNGQATGGSGGSMPGSSGNGQGFGYMIGGASDSESSYLVDGQDTENISGGYSKANVPMDFIQEVEMKTSGVSAEYGGALGGVVNAITKQGSNDFHGEIYSYYDSSSTDANPVNAYLRYDPTATPNGIVDPASQVYSSRKDHFRNVLPGLLVSGPVYRDRIWFTTAFQPQINTIGRTVNFGSGSSDPTLGEQYFTRNRIQYFGLLRLDAALSSKVRVYFKWLPEDARETGASMPHADPIASQSTYLNTAVVAPISQYAHGIGWSSPIATYNAGADVTLTQHLVSTTRYGYFFDNYHDFGWPTTVPDLEWEASGVGGCDNSGSKAYPNACPNGGAPLPQALQQPTSTSTAPYNQSYTLFDSDKHYQFDQDFAFYHGGWWGSHNLKFGYQLNHLVNIINQNGNVPYAFVFPGLSGAYSPVGAYGAANCAVLGAQYAYVNSSGKTVKPCTGMYGTLEVQDFATILEDAHGKPTPASDWNHALYIQDSWNVGKGLTLDLGLRIEKESLPAPGGIQVSAINFPWSDKIEPRVGAAWDPTGKGKMKVFGSYGVVNDVMKLLLAQTSWGAQAYEDCEYPLGPDGTVNGFSVSDITLKFVQNRACPNGAANVGANFANSAVPTSLTDNATGVGLIENTAWRAWEPVAPGVKPYRQHEYVLGWDYQLKPNVIFHARYDRRRLDHAIEDASLWDVNWGETYAIVNPGEGVDSSIDKFASYLGGLGEAFGVPGWSFDTADFGTCPSCPSNVRAIRNYDGLELRLSLADARHFTGDISYTYSSLWGNYPGLTTTDQTDGGTTGRNSPDTTRAFDEPFYYIGANGKSNAGPMPTDRPNVFKGNAYYTFGWWKHQSASLGVFQQFLQGSPMSSYLDIGYGNGVDPVEATYIFGRGKWVDMAVNPTNGAINIGQPYTKRTPWFTQSDLNASDTVKTGEHQSISFEVTATNAFNQHAVTSYWGGMNSLTYRNFLAPGNVPIFGGAPFYQQVESGYNVQQYLTANGSGSWTGNVIGNGQYGQPFLFQLGRQVRFAVRFTF